jgi:acyl-CoA thioesterase
MANFLRATEVTRKGDDCIAEIDHDWFIWGPFGGYLAALALRAMAGFSHLPRPAAFSCQFLRTAPAGPVSFAVERRNSGRRAALLRACATQGREPFLDAQCWFVAGDLSGLTHDCATMPPVERAPQLPPWSGFGDDDESRSPMWKHIERRPPLALRSFAAAPAAPKWACWLRLLEALPADDLTLQAARAVLWMDLAPWNAALMAHGWPTTHVAPTLELTVQFQPHLYGAKTSGSAWLLAETDSPVAGEGLFGAQSRLWSESGELVAASTAQALCAPNPRHPEHPQARVRALPPVK